LHKANCELNKVEYDELYNINDVFFWGLIKHRKEHKGANLFKNTRISTTRDHKEYKGANLFINTRISTTRGHKESITWTRLLTKNKFVIGNQRVKHITFRPILSPSSL